jgi:hypothetical protein
MEQAIEKVRGEVNVLKSEVENIKKNVESIKTDLKEDIAEVKESQSKMTYWIMGTLASSLISLIILIFNILGGK